MLFDISKRSTKAPPWGNANICKAKQQYFENKIKKANGGCETDA